MKAETNFSTPCAAEIARAIIAHRLHEMRSSAVAALGEGEPSEAPYQWYDLLEAVRREFGGKMADEAAHMEAGYLLGVEMGAQIGGAR